MSNLSDLFVSYKIVNDSPVTVPKYDITVAPETMISQGNMLTKVERVKERMKESPKFNWKTSGTIKSDPYPTALVVQEPLRKPVRNYVETLSTLKISDEMFESLLGAEGKHSANGKLVAKSEKEKFGEDFVTGPYGMVYKHIDSEGKLLDKPETFKEGEEVDAEWARANARASYNKKAQEWSKLLEGKEEVTQDKIDALVAASGGTTKSRNATKKFVLEHWGDWKAIDNHLRTHATTAAGNGKRLPGLVLRRLFEANWFAGDRKPWKWYDENRRLFNI